MTRDPSLRATLLAVILIGITAPALPDDIVFGDRVEVELVLVDVFVETKGGDPVTDLTVDDFRLFQDRKEVEISQFTPAQVALRSEGEGGASGSSTATPGSAVPLAPRQLVLFLDNLHLHPNSRSRIMRTLSQNLKDYLAPADEVMVVGYGGTTEVLLPMTTDRGALKRILREQAESGAVSLLATLDDRRVMRLIETRHSAETLSSRIAGDPCVDIGAIAHAHAQEVQGRVLSTVSELNRFVNSLAGYHGRKVLLHVSDGIPLVPGAEAYRYASELCDGTGANKGLENAVDAGTFGTGRLTRWDPTKTAATLQEFNTAGEWTRLAGHANTYQVSFYMFQARMSSNRAASVDSARTSYDTEFEGRRNMQDALFLLADETGGRAILDENDIERALVGMAEDWQVGYQLAYEPPTAPDGRLHRIRVEIDRPGIRIRHRKSYRSKRQDERIADGVISALIHGQFDNPLEVRLKIGEQRPSRKGLSNVSVRVQVPLQHLVLLPEDGVNRGLFTVFVAARGAGGQVTPVGQKTVPLRVPIEGGEPNFVYTVEIPIWGDEGRVAVAVQDQLGGDVSYVGQRIRIHPTS